MFFKTFTIDGLNFGNKFTVLFDAEGFQKLLLDSCTASILKVYKFNTLSVYITCSSIDEYYNELISHHLNKIKKFLYSKKNEI